LEKEIEFMRGEQNQKELDISELKDRLRKREDELRELKSNLNGQIAQVYDTY
jgi:predicted  nucleic acid-binding Zn-ribbon protein